jgi:hypothetical protein
MMVQIEFDQLKETQGTKTGSPYHGVLRAVAKFSLTIVDGVSVIVAEQGVPPSEAGGVANEVPPPALPVDLCPMTPRAFSAAALQKQRNRLLNKVSEQDIDDVNAQFRRLRIAYREEEGVKMKLDAHHSKTSVQSFKECWTPLGKDCDALEELCGGLASVMPGTSSVLWSR